MLRLYAIFFAGCAVDAYVEPPPAWSIAQQHASVVEMQPCGGSGVVVGADRVLTASHVACAPNLLAWRDEAHDLALVLVNHPGPDAVLDIARAGDAVCAEVALPARSRMCGHITRIDDIGTVHGRVNLWIDIHAVPGNSGAPLFDIGGHLVGIITDGVDGIGLASSVYDRVSW